MSESALIVCVPEAETLVHGLRERFDPSAQLGVPAHITIIFPFMAPTSIDKSVLQRIERLVSQVAQFEFSLTRVARFARTAYLEPEPAAPFVNLTEGLTREFPQFPPFAGEFATVIPHLTVANGNVAEAELVYGMLETALSLHGAIGSTCSSLVLIENSSGSWSQVNSFPLGCPSQAVSKA